ncbi:MAG TPA: RluA family pseudouridine synthase [Candidatus Sulfotelmatobacter sp.]|jgi:23S rRNA pseudouridine1911/1915/1917 synthase|nr:RluA family pseudouridine synthase [Candidatus Sulfotelmatobacter sp.]
MNSRLEKFTVELSRPGIRFDTFLRERFPAASRGAMQRLIEQGHVRVNGHGVKPSHTPRSGEQVEIYFPEPKSAEARPEEIPLEILFEDKSLLVLNKPAGIVVHPAAGHEEHTLVNALLHHCRGSLSGIGGVARPGIVHRLDKETSGCLVVAKNDKTHLALSKQFAERTVKKFYDALVIGVPKTDSGEILAAIARHPTHRKRMAVHTGSNGRAAHTTWRILENLTLAAHVEAEIHTGRTHQIRVHFQHLGHPLLGDETYGAKQNNKFSEATNFSAPRVMLHAHRLSFIHPRTGKTVKFEAPLPADFAAALKLLRKIAAKK